MISKKRILDQVNRITIIERNKFLNFQKLLENSFKKIYSETDRKISSRVFRGLDQSKNTEEILDDVTNIMRDHSKKAGKLFIESIHDFIRDGLITGIKVQKYLDKIIPKQTMEADIELFDDPEMQILFNALYNEAVESLKFTVDGVELSNKIWDLDNISLQNMRNYMHDAVISGKSKSEIYSYFKGFLNTPDADMRKKVWIEYFKTYPPGPGIYKSAWANVMRTLRTETNRAFREGFKEYAKDKNWVESIKFNRVAGSEPCEICDELAEADDYGLGPGCYPADEAPDSGHPHCFCYYTYIIILPEKLLEAISI